MARRLGGGKTSPRLLEDVKLYNPQRLPNTQHNILIQLPPPFDGGNPPRKIAKGACKHTWALKPHQTSVEDLSGGSEGQSRVTAALCAECRMHLKLQITYPPSTQPLTPCPNQDAFLHHFVHVPTEFSGFARRDDYGGQDWWQALEHFRCTSDKCQAELAVYTRSPRLIPQWVELLTSEQVIAQRAQAAIATDPERFEGVAVPTAIQVLGNLRTYLMNAMNGNDRRIMASNKKWMVTLGDPCSDLLNYLGFKRTKDEWAPPDISSATETPLENELAMRIDDVIKELTVLLNEQNAEERRMGRVDSSMNSALNEIRKLLGCFNYATNPGAQRINSLEEDEHPFYAGLGSVRDFHDDLLAFAYDRQQITDPDNSPYYLQCLQGIAKGRQSEVLSTKAAIEESSGRVSLDDIRSAYEAFNFDYQAPGLSEETIIGTFQSRIADAPRQEPELRRCLKIIGRHLNNSRIEHHAADTLTSYEQALEWLGATADMQDEFVVTLYSVKINENPENAAMARQALQIIGKKHGSESLEVYPDTGELKESDMDPAHAYSRLGVPDRTAEDELVVSAYEVAVADAPSQKHELLRALKAIGKDRNSFLLLAMCGSGDDTSKTDHKLSEWPVGLDNIGNTCYLNSLLQYFFTIKPLRSLVLNNKEFMMRIDGTNVQKKKVGSRQVTRREIERAQKFISELSALFNDMISSPVAQITPKLELARLTMLNSSAEEDLRRNSILSGHRPSLDEITEERSQRLVNESDDAVLAESPSKTTPTQEKLELNAMDGIDDLSSEGTLVDDRAADDAMDTDLVKKPVQVFEDKENVPPTKSPFDKVHTPDRELKPLGETSPSRVNEQERVDQSDKIMNGVQGPEAPPSSQAPIPPTRPPPVPPREKPEKKTTIREEEELYRQQDVTEVIGNVLFQLQCAIKPEKIDASGEQIDLIKELFYGKVKTTTTNAAGKSRTMEEFFSDLKINVHSGPQDLYTAIDASLEKRMVEVGGSEEAQYNSISELPAILQFYPNRTGFDREKGTPYKVNHHLKFYETIYMDRYMDTSDPQVQLRRSKSWDIKERMKKINERRTELGSKEMGLSKVESLQLTAKFIDQLQALNGVEDLVPASSPSLAEKVRQAATDVRQDLEDLANEERQLSLQLSAVWEDPSFQSLAYRLHAVFMHRGLVTSGHYWTYIYDAPANIWRKYNDGYVTQVTDPNSDIFGQELGDRPATAMFLVYVRQKDESELAETVHRELPPEAHPDNPIPSVESDSQAMEGVETSVPNSLPDGAPPPQKAATWSSKDASQLGGLAEQPPPPQPLPPARAKSPLKSGDLGHGKTW